MVLLPTIVVAVRSPPESAWRRDADQRFVGVTGSLRAERRTADLAGQRIVRATAPANRFHFDAYRYTTS
jgi:hypothetical protein